MPAEMCGLQSACLGHTRDKCTHFRVSNMRPSLSTEMPSGWLEWDIYKLHTHSYQPGVLRPSMSDGTGAERS